MTVKLIDEWGCDVRGYVMLNSFAGGDKGRCVQLTTGGGEGYVQMTFDNAREFFKLCIEEINNIEKQFNECPPWWEAVRVNSSGVTHDLRGHIEHCDIPHIDSPVFIDDENELQQEKEQIIREVERHGVAMAGLQQRLFLINEKIQSSASTASRPEATSEEESVSKKEASTPSSHALRETDTRSSKPKVKRGVE